MRCSVTDLFGAIVSMLLRKASQTTSTFFCPEPGWVWTGLPSGRGYMLLVVSSSLEEKRICQDLIVFPDLSTESRRSQEFYFSSVRKRLMWFVELSCVMKVSMFSRKTCGRRRTLTRDQS